MAFVDTASSSFSSYKRDSRMPRLRRRRQDLSQILDIRQFEQMHGNELMFLVKGAKAKTLSSTETKNTHCALQENDSDGYE
jgi:hypothetical protein